MSASGRPYVKKRPVNPQIITGFTKSNSAGPSTIFAWRDLKRQPLGSMVLKVTSSPGFHRFAAPATSPAQAFTALFIATHERLEHGFAFFFGNAHASLRPRNRCR
jgi:hypothetical protein